MEVPKLKIDFDQQIHPKKDETRRTIDLKIGKRRSRTKVHFLISQKVFLQIFQYSVLS